MWAVHVSLCTVALSAAVYGLTSIRDSLTHPVHVYEGDDALITCVVRDVRDNTVMWKKEDRERHTRRVLTAGESRVIADKRFDVLHDAGGDVWVLVIKEAKPADSGMYVCEVNSNPIVRSFHKLSVLSRALLPPDNGSLPFLYDGPRGGGVRNHNYTDCCVANNVSHACFGFCNIQSILDGNTGQDPEQCERDFPAIVRCMADGRNHVPCCMEQSVPDICQDVCRGEYTLITDNVKTHFSCSAYTEHTLACIAEGIELLPSPPSMVEVEALTEHSVNVSWRPPSENPEGVAEYVVSVRGLRSFDGGEGEGEGDEQEKEQEQEEEQDSYLAAAGVRANVTTSSTDPHTVTLQIPGTYNSTIVNDLRPYTMYEIAVVAKNHHGSSLPSYAVRTLTLSPGKAKTVTGGHAPPLPDIRSCCLSKGITHATCLSKLCDPAQSGIAEVTDLMICAPWATATFGCLTNGLDHTPCCQQRGLPKQCHGLCTGNLTHIDFSYFKCLKYMGDYTSCLLQGYGVLASAPTAVAITYVDSEYVIVQWSPPATLGDSVLHYTVHYRQLAGGDPQYHAVPKVSPPFILEHLEADTEYEVYVEAVNVHGPGEPSSRLVVRTESKMLEEKVQEALYYNVTACCVGAALSSVCLPLCTYDASMADIKALAGVCAGDLHKLLRCGAGGRNHNSCCSRRGVASACLSVCSGVLLDPVMVTVTTCIPYIGNIVQCFEEGAGLLPGPVSELHATMVTDTSIVLVWEPPEDGNVTNYVVHYQKVDNTSWHESAARLDNQENVTHPMAHVMGLETGRLYSFFVVSQNVHGTSLPSSMLMVNIVHTDVGDTGIPAVTSPPHSLAVASHSATWVTIAWQPPELSHPAEQLTYRLYHKPASDGDFQMVETSVTSHTMEGLQPNTQYIVYATAVSSKGQSLPSETLIAWTDPAYPAFVEPPTVHPINLVIEGSTMTILCIAMGTPMPTISLYISGRLVRQEVTRHMVTVIHNVTRDMDQISCYADNGYGIPMQASRKITISHVPHITASIITMAAHGDSVVLECQVDAHPEPKMMFWRDPNGRVPVIQGGKYDISIQPSKEEEAKYTMHLTIHKMSDEDDGDYFCHAENAFGNATQPVSVRIRNVAATNNVTQCCIEQNVTAACMDACSFYLDMDAVIDKPDCINDFDKLMKCAADGSDHRNCCGQWGVPRRCLDWCRGEPLLNNKLCVLSYTKQIAACFHEGRDRLPGPPQNVHTEVLDAHSVLVKWDPPVKNPNTVDMYRVFWREIGGRSSSKNDTKWTKLRITQLKEGVLYECVIKAGNHLGTSTLTNPVNFTTRDKYITSAANTDGDASHVGVAVGVVLALIIVAAIVVGTVWFVRARRMLGHKSSGGVAFENPSYLREVNMDHIQIPSGQSELTVPNGNGLANGVNPAGTQVQPQQGWKQETLHVPAQATEVAPSLYEELKLGQDGAGFRRLK